MIAVIGRPDLTHFCIWIAKYSNSYMVVLRIENEQSCSFSMPEFHEQFIYTIYCQYIMVVA